LTHLLQRLRWSAAPPDATPIQRQNFINVQIDGVAIGVTAAAAPFLPVFLARLGASNFQVGLLTAMPALAGLLLAVPVGRFLERRRRIVPWYGGARFAYVMAYAVTGLIPFVVPPQYLVPAILVVWAAATLPQTTLNIAFSVVMNAVAGSKGRYELMSRRWSVLGFTTAVTVAVVGQALERLRFPLNYQFVFVGLSLAVLLSLYFSSRLQLPERDPAPPAPNRSWAVRLRDFARRIRAQPAFVGFTAKRFVFLAGVALAAPIFPLYYVREARASEQWIGFIGTAQTAILLAGYPLWARFSRTRGSRFVLLWATGGLALHPALTALTQRVEIIVVLAGLAGIFQAGMDLVFFDELMKTVPAERTATFVSLAQSLQYLSMMVAPLLGTTLADYVGLGGALLASAGLRLLGFALFTRGATRV
jgi:MFS family permease